MVAVGVDGTAFLAARRGQHTQFNMGIIADATALTASLRGPCRCSPRSRSSSSRRPLDEIRRHRQQEQLGRRGHTGDSLYWAQRNLRRDLHTRTVPPWARSELAVTIGDPNAQLLSAFQEPTSCSG